MGIDAKQVIQGIEQDDSLPAQVKTLETARQNIDATIPLLEKMLAQARTEQGKINGLMASVQATKDDVAAAEAVESGHNGSWQQAKRQSARTEGAYHERGFRDAVATPAREGAMTAEAKAFSERKAAARKSTGGLGKLSAAHLEELAARDKSEIDYQGDNSELSDLKDRYRKEIAQGYTHAPNEPLVVTPKAPLPPEHTGRMVAVDEADLPQAPQVGQEVDEEEQDEPGTVKKAVIEA